MTFSFAYPYSFIKKNIFRHTKTFTVKEKTVTFLEWYVGHKKRQF